MGSIVRQVLRRERQAGIWESIMPRYWTGRRIGNGGWDETRLRNARAGNERRQKL
jgi:hypothetical protein